MLTVIRHWILRLLGGQIAPSTTDTEVRNAVEIEHITHMVPYDENLLERARTQWQFGDWQSLAQISQDTLQHHPDRAKLALLAAAGQLQIGNPTEANKLLNLARDWGLSNKLVSQILIAGVYNSLGRATLLTDQKKSLEHFNKSIGIGMPSSEASLLSKARMNEQLLQLQPFNSPIQEPDCLALTETNYCTATSKAYDIHKSKIWIHNYWKSSQQNPLEYMNADKKRSLRLVEIIQEYIKPGKILEIGSNAGRNLHFLYAAGYSDLEGIEISPKAIEVMRKGYPELENISIHEGAVEDVITSFADNSFQCVYTMAVLEHIHFDSDWIFSHIARIAQTIITIEDELRAGERHFPRNYERVFSGLGFRQIHLEGCTKWGLPTGFAARVFIQHKSKTDKTKEM